MSISDAQIRSIARYYMYALLIAANFVFFIWVIKFTWLLMLSANLE